MWEIAYGLMNIDLSEALTIIDDATCNGFEFKIENHTIYYREIDN